MFAFDQSTSFSDQRANVRSRWNRSFLTIRLS